MRDDSAEYDRATHRCEDCKTGLTLLYDERDDTETPPVCGECGGTNVHALATDGGSRELVHPKDVLYAGFTSPWMYATMGLIITPFFAVPAFVESFHWRTFMATYVGTAFSVSLADAATDRISYPGDSDE